MARIVVAQRARSDLAHLMETRGLPADTPARIRAAVTPLATFPLAGRRLTGRWQGARVVVGPWPWMLIVYVYDEGTQTVGIAAIQDARSGSSATSGG